LISQKAWGGPAPFDALNTTKPLRGASSHAGFDPASRRLKTNTVSKRKKRFFYLIDGIRAWQV
jgi:hypothetical protein